jgi:hypothetical protein
MTEPSADSRKESTDTSAESPSVPTVGSISHLPLSPAIDDKSLT